MKPFLRLSLMNSFKVGKSIGAFGKNENKFVQECFKLLVVMNETGLIVVWKLAKKTR